MQMQSQFELQKNNNSINHKISFSNHNIFF